MFHPRAKLFHCPSVGDFISNGLAVFKDYQLHYVIPKARESDSFDKFCRFSSYLIFKICFTSTAQ